MNFTAKDVAALRELTGVGMMDCKKALTETGGDLEAAQLYLREKGLAAAEKKASRVAADGMVIATVADNGIGAIVEVNSETDFAAKSEKFVEFVNSVANVVAQGEVKEIEGLEAAQYPGSDMTVAEMLRDCITVIGENLKIRRFAQNNGFTNVAYNHGGGRIGVLLSMNVSDNLKGNDAVITMGKNIAMQIAAMNPLWLTSADACAETVERERNIIKTQILEEGKPEHVADKIVEGRIAKYYSEVCLLNQHYVQGDKITVQQYVEQTAKELGGTIELTDFVRFEKGEGIEKKEDDFAAEVAKMSS